MLYKYYNKYGNKYQGREKIKWRNLQQKKIRYCGGEQKLIWSNIRESREFNLQTYIYLKDQMNGFTDYYTNQGYGLYKYKTEFEWLKEVDSLALANAQINLDKAYKNFFRDKSVGFPKFKSKKSNYNSYTTNNQNGTIYIEKNHVKLPKLKSMIKIKQHREFEGIIKSCTVSQVPSGKYFISILVDTEIMELPKTDSKIGVDVGIKEFAITSDWDFFGNPKQIKKSEKRLAQLQKDLSRKEKGSNNRRKAKIKVAKLHEKIANQRKDMLHKVSTQFINENQVIVIEDLKVSNVIKDILLERSERP